MKVEYDLVIDFARPSKSNTIIISEGDSNSRLCRFVLLSNKQPFDMLDVSTATVKGVKTDGSVIYGDGTIVKDEDDNNINEVLYTLPAAVSDLAGKTTMTITLMSNTGESLTSFEFYVQTRNSLYSEDDYISDTDLSGFRDLLNRSNAALQKMEEMTTAEALPNPYPINIYTNKEEYHYNGSEKVDVELGNIAYLEEENLEYEESVDETAAASAAESARQAKASAQSAASSKANVETMKGEVATMETDSASYASTASTAAINASRSAITANEKAEAATEALATLNSTIDNKVTTITTQLAGAMIDDIIEDAEGYKTAAGVSATAAAQSAIAAKEAADSVQVSATKYTTEGVHIADLNVNGVITELYAPAAESAASTAAEVTYSHLASELEASNVQDAIDEVASQVKEFGGIKVMTSEEWSVFNRTTLADGAQIGLLDSQYVGYYDKELDALYPLASTPLHFTKAEWAEMDHRFIPHETNVIITDDSISSICATVEECELSTNPDDVAAASAVKDLADILGSHWDNEQRIGTWCDGYGIYRNIVYGETSTYTDLNSRREFNIVKENYDIDNILNVKGYFKALSGSVAGVVGISYVWGSTSFNSSLASLLSCSTTMKDGKIYFRIQMSTAALGITSLEYCLAYEYTKRD